MSTGAIYNNSDDEEASAKYDDFVSFPTLPDPQLDNSQTLSKIFSQTLRKVTHNASNLVASYNSPVAHVNRIDEIQSAEELSRAPSDHAIEDSIAPDSILHDDHDLGNSIAAEDSKLKPSHALIAESTENKYNLYKADDLKLVPASTPLPLSPSISREESVAPRVTSDFKTLRLSTLIPKETFSSTSSLVNINATQIDSKRRPALTKEKSLTTKISSIFTNLPNDIELSDDSASDTETIPGMSPIHASGQSLMHRVSLSIDSPALSYYDMSSHAESVTESSPVKAELIGINRTQHGTSSSLSSFYALKNKDMKSKTASNLSNLIIDNARSIINHNIVSSASSIVTSRSKEKAKRKKKKPKRSSDNPLKNGGIPKKYWMNDSFVSDCLNCFKPFTAFRRKHHCRFCGQIFCSDCTLFISYNQHKEERKNGAPIKKVFNDKLRVCKPCYSDVIVYLSDDSTSSEDEEETNKVATPENKSEKDKVEDSAQLKLRGRSMSITSRMSESTRRQTLDSSESLHTGETFALPLDIKVNPKQAPQMAIPATRKGEAVEIPIPKNSYTNSVALNERYSSVKSNHLHHHLHNQYSNIGTPPSSQSGNLPTSSSKTWLKNYNHLIPGSLSSPDLNHGSYENLNHMYSGLLGRKSSQGKFRIQSGSDKDLFHLQSAKTFDYSPARDSRSIASTSNESYSEGEDSHHESENEDEQAMSLYTSLTLGGYNNNAKTTPRNTSSTGFNVVPTLREFPNMQGNDLLFPRYPGIAPTTPFPKFINNSSTSTAASQKKQISFLEDHPQSEYLRSHERAHASLVRMRSRRKSKSRRNVLILTQNNYRLPSFDKTNQITSPILSPSSPANQSFLSSKGNLSKILSEEKEGLSDSTFENQISPSVMRNRPSFDIEVSQDLADVEDNGEFEVSSFMNNDDEATELDLAKNKEQIYNELLDKVLYQCLKDCDIEEDADKWVFALKDCLEKINLIKLTDTLDIKQYVKIKKIMGGSASDTHVLDGLFFTKNIDSKRMPSNIRNPKIALLMFPIEYLKQKEQFISLRIIHSQQTVYITNLVSRLVSMEPDIVVVGDTVCGLAINLLEEAGITVISNVKPQIIERISRYTKADIFQSVNDLFFKKGVLGECSQFEVKRYTYKNLVKTFSFFTGSDITSGFTISLRGGDEELLNSIKYAAETLLPGYLNAKFEKSLLEDHAIHLSIGNQNEVVDEINRKLDEIEENKLETEDILRNCEFSLDGAEVVNYVKLFNERNLSLSPCVKYTLPSPLVNVIKSYYNFYQFFKTHKLIQSFDSVDSIEPSVLGDFQIKFDEVPQKSDLLKYLKYASEDRVKVLRKKYEDRARIWSNCMSYSTYQLYPIFHRLIHVLHSSVSIKHATPCNGPSTVVIDYYTDNDKCLGLFLDQIFQESPRICQECGDSMLNHYKTYAHGDAKLDIIIEKFESINDQIDYPGKNQRIMWSYCKVCNFTTPVVPMHDETYYLSIGKFLELSFYGEGVTVNSSTCNHSFYKNYIRCFGINDLVIRLEYSKIDTYEVVVPKKQLEFVSELDINLKIEVMNSIQEKSSIFFQSVSKRLNRVKVDTYAKADEGLQKIEELKQKLEFQIHNIKTKTEEIYNSCSPVTYINLNTILRDLQELGVEWDKEFNEFEMKFLPSETEITKITQFHLRNFLLDKYNENGNETELGEKLDESNSTEDKNQSTSNQVKLDNETDTDSISSTSSIRSATESEYHLPTLNREKTKEIGSLIPSSLYEQSSFMNKINMWKELADKEVTGNSSNAKVINSQPSTGSLISMNRKGSNSSTNSNKSNVKTVANITPTKINTAVSGLAGAPGSKVHQLASFFDKMNIDQISLEFKKQREQELQKRSKNKFIAIPIVESKPIVEIYDNIEEAVDVHDESKKLKAVASDDKNSSKKIEEAKEDNDLTSSEIPQPEKQSLLKSLTNFWADRSATLWDPLKYALESHEHTFADSDVIVREDEPSSLVAFCLSSSDYVQKIKTMEQEHDFSISGDNLEDNDLDNKKLQNFIKLEKKFKQNYDDSSNITPLEKILIKKKSNHLKYQFNDGNTNLSCKIFYSEQFEALRESCGNRDSFIQSLSRCIKWDSKGGKSRSSFLKTLDNRYIIKELSSSELESFVSIAPFYFRYISQSIFKNLSSAIAKIFGFYQIELKNTLTGKTFKMDFLIMENLFYNHNTTRIFDLKGSMRNRHVQQTGKQDEVLLDENMIEYIYESPVFVKEHSKKLLRGSLFNDTSFLSAMDVMDYSLVVGIDDKSQKLYIGIIDWLRTFTWDKKVENWVKGNNLMGGNKKGKDPTIVTPKQYRTRFREAMERYILEVPDIWYEGSKQIV